MLKYTNFIISNRITINNKFEHWIAKVKVVPKIVIHETASEKRRVAS
jgi:hypothetical protein